MSDTGKHINYTAADIEKYHKGLLTPAAMHAMEKAALDDPFLADAIEGYATVPGQATALADLKNRLEQRISASPPIPMYPEKKDIFNWWKVAAMIVLIAGAGWLIYNLSLKNQATPEEAIAATTVKDTNTASAPLPNTDATTKAPAVSRSGNTAATDKSATAERKEVYKKRTAPLNTERNYSKADVAANAPPKTETNSAAIITADEVTAEPEVTVISSAAKPNQKKISATSTTEKTNNESITLPGRKQKSDTTPAFYFSGRVTDSLKNPLYYVSILNTTTKVALSTDKNGYFSFLSTDSMPVVTASAVGFETQKWILEKAPEINNIILQPSGNALSEVVVVGYGSKQKKETPFDVNEAGATPLGGWKAFNDYVRKNRIKPVAGENNKFTAGKVTLSFDINKNNRPENIIVSQSLCEACDKEAIRLLLEGPGWIKSTDGRKAMVIIRF